MRAPSFSEKKGCGGGGVKEKQLNKSAKSGVPEPVLGSRGKPVLRPPAPLTRKRKKELARENRKLESEKKGPPRSAGMRRVPKKVQQRGREKNQSRSKILGGRGGGSWRRRGPFREDEDLPRCPPGSEARSLGVGEGDRMERAHKAY